MTVIGSYEVIRQIGEGGFGRTYEARHIIIPSIKACLKQHINLSAEDVKLLEREAEVLSSVHHYSLPAFRDFFRAGDGSHVLAMSFVEGKSLDKVIAKHKALHPEEVCWISQRLLNALFYLHHKGVVHGDVKPPNVIVQPWEHNALLVDFGLASYHPTRKSTAAGYTAIFAAPEVVEGKPPIPESDLYAMGLTMIYALGGDPIAKSLPDYVPKALQDFCSDLVRFNVLDRPNWEKQDLVARLSDVRQEVFGRRVSKK